MYLREGDHVLLLDAGTGMTRLVTEPALLEGVRRLDVVLSHFHLDHTVGLACAPGLSALETRELWAPGRIVASVPAEELVHRLLGPPFLLPTPDALGSVLTSIHELAEDVTIGPFRLELRVQPLHVGPTLGLKVNGEVAYCTDTAYDPDTVAFARGARVLLHEAFHAADETDDRTHTAAGEAGRIAAAAGVERLVLVHVHPLLADDEELARFARARFDASEAGRDGPLD